MFLGSTLNGYIKEANYTQKIRQGQNELKYNIPLVDLFHHHKHISWVQLNASSAKANRPGNTLFNSTNFLLHVFHTCTGSNYPSTTVMSFPVNRSRKYIVILLQIKKQENFLLLEEMFGIIETDKFSLAH